MHSIAHVYASPLRRARETAEIIASGVGVARVDVDERLRERANWGDVAGVSWDDFVARWERSNVDRDYVIPGGISAREAGRRAAAFVHDVHAAEPDEHVVAVTHGGIIVDLLVECLDDGSGLIRRHPELRHMAWCTITELDVNDGACTQVRLADWRDGSGA